MTRALSMQRRDFHQDQAAARQFLSQVRAQGGVGVVAPHYASFQGSVERMGYDVHYVSGKRVAGHVLRHPALASALDTAPPEPSARARSRALSMKRRDFRVELGRARDFMAQVRSAGGTATLISVWTQFPSRLAWMGYEVHYVSGEQLATHARRHPALAETLEARAGAKAVAGRA